jgi:hypothetical protein
VLLTVAGRLETGDPPSSPAIQQALNGMNLLVQKRIELDLTRKRILAGQTP